MPNQRVFIIDKSVRRNPRFAVAVLATLLLSTNIRFAQAAEFIPLAPLPGNTQVIARAVSDDGAVVAGFSQGGDVQTQAFRWTEQTGMLGLGALPGDTDSSVGLGYGGAQPLSGDGSTIVGRSILVTDDGAVNDAFIHNEVEGMRGLGSSSWAANDVSRDGSAVVGIVDSRVEAFRWPEADGLAPLGFLPGMAWSNATDISDDGATIVGFSGKVSRTDDEFYEIYKWSAETGMSGLGIIVEANSRANAVVSGDGSVIAGDSIFDSLTDDREAFYWTKATGAVGLGWLPLKDGAAGTRQSVVRDMTPDGRLLAETKVSGTVFGFR